MRQRNDEERRKKYDEVNQEVIQGASMSAAARKAGISEGTFRNWRKKYLAPKQKRRTRAEPSLLTLEAAEIPKAKALPSRWVMIMDPETALELLRSQS